MRIVLFGASGMIGQAVLRGSDELARAMLRVARHGAPAVILYSRDLRAMLA